jgi:hypothetical protein
VSTTKNELKSPLLILIWSSKKYRDKYGAINEGADLHAEYLTISMLHVHQGATINDTDQSKSRLFIT